MKTKSNNKQPFLLKNTHVFILECIIILVFSISPVFRNFSTNGTTYLSWEGAYRLYLGQIPYKDFGLPMGFAYWIIPAFFFKVFGPYLFTLIKAQAFINIISAFSFRSILRSLKIFPPFRFLCLLIFLISYSYLNYWPWYNHTVIVFELVGMAFLLKYIFGEGRKTRNGYLFLSSFFTFLAFFTKQDSGVLALLIALAVILAHVIYEKRIMPVVWFIGFYILIALCVFLPFIPYHIGYWFNYGQPPHYDRLSFYDVINVFLKDSPWLKFYILIIVLILISKTRDLKRFLSDKKTILFTILTLGILFQASIIQVTSYVPEDGNIFFHSFAIAYIATLSNFDKRINFRKPIVIGLTSILVLLWWSQHPWRYVNSVIVKHFPTLTHVDDNEVSIDSYLVNPRQYRDSENHQLVLGHRKPFKHIYLPQESVDGIDRIMNLAIVKEKGSQIHLLNMSELTPIECVMGYIPETGPNIPLWYHKNVGMFEKQLMMYKNRIKNNYYDLVIFEYLPDHNNFFPFEIRDELQKEYEQVDRIPLATKVPDSQIDVFIRKEKK